MHEIATSGAPVRGGFIHIPMPRPNKALSAGGLLDAAMIAVRASVKAGDASPPPVYKNKPAPP
jgi:pyrrolidone-carboxylate peptidase